MEQTAVEWYAEQMQSKEQFTQEEFNNITNQAKEMEKQQIIDSYIECKRQYIVEESCFPPQFVVKEAEQYYNNKFKNNQDDHII
jgi:hypothetical protein